MLNSELLPALLPADRGGFHRAPEPLNPTQSTVSSRSSGLSPRPNCSSCEIVGQFCMDGPHDLGGKIGFGEVTREANEPAFHQPWEGLAWALNVL